MDKARRHFKCVAPPHMVDGGGLAARAAALQLLEKATERRGALDEALNLPAFAKLSARDRAFARALVMATLRNHGRIERALDKRLKQKPSAAVLRLMRIGAAQLFALDVPDFAAVSTTVKLAERDNATRPFKGLINAVLRGIVREGAPPSDPSANAPDWLYRRWAATWGDVGARGIAGMIPDEPATDLTLRDRGTAETWAERLEADVLPGGGLRTRRKGDLAEWPGYDDGAWWVQDAAAAAPVRLLSPRPGETVVDLCAAPGGKTLQLAAAGATVTALDRSASRLKRLRQNLERTALSAEMVVADAETWPDERRFDAVLLDAPCTATGTFRRNPDVLWASKPADVAKLADVQHRLLDSAAERVKPGGRLVYCVCSLEREEGETQILAFLRRNPAFATEPTEAAAVGVPEASVTPEGWLRLLPQHRPGGQDGFFAALLKRKG